MITPVMITPVAGPTRTNVRRKGAARSPSITDE